MLDSILCSCKILLVGNKASYWAGCTEIPLALKAEHLSVPYFDALTILARAAIRVEPPVPDELEEKFESFRRAESPGEYRFGFANHLEPLHEMIGHVGKVPVILVGERLGLEDFHEVVDHGFAEVIPIEAAQPDWAVTSELELHVAAHTLAELYAVLSTLPLRPRLTPGGARRLPPGPLPPRITAPIGVNQRPDPQQGFPMSG